MDWFTSNPIAQMPGPSFLVLYASAAVVTLVIAAARIRAADTTAAMPPLPVPTDPDPYEIAYLRGGANEVTRAVIFSLIERGYLGVTNEKEARKQQIRRGPDPPSLDALSPLERRVFGRFDTPRRAHEVFRADIRRQVESQCASYKAKLLMRGLLVSPEFETTRLIAWLIGAAVIISLGGYKLIASLVRDYENVGFLVGIGIATNAVLIWICFRRRRVAARGRQYLHDLRIAFEPLKRHPALASSPGAASSLPLLVAVFGVGVLAATQFGYYPQMFSRASSGGTGSGGGCGSACGSSCGGGCGGGCGGCGGCGGG